MSLDEWFVEAERRMIPAIPGPVIWLTEAERAEITEQAKFSKAHVPGESFLGMRVCVIDRPPRQGTAGWYYVNESAYKA